MELLHRLTKKNLQLNKKRTIVTIIGIILSVALITAVSTVFMSGYKSILQFEKMSEGDYHIVFENVKKENFDKIKDNRYVENYFYSYGIGYSVLEESKNEYKPYLYVLAFNKEGLKKAGLVLSEGRLPEKEDELLITTQLKTNARVKYNVGDTLKIDVGKRMSEGYELNQHNPYNPEVEEELVDTETKEYKIVGIIERPSRIIEDYSSPGYSVVTYTDKMDDKTNIYVRLNKKGLKDTKKAVSSLMGIDYSTYLKLYRGELSEDEEKELFASINMEVDVNEYLIMLETDAFTNDAAFQALGMVVLVVIGIIIVASVFCIKNSFDISIAEKTKQYGMLASIGATKKQIRKNVFYEAFRLGLVGIPCGIALGLFASWMLIIISNLLLFNNDTLGLNSHEYLIFSISIPAIIVSIILGIVTLFFSSLRSARKASKIAPISAIRNSEEIKIKANKIKSPKFIKKLFGVGGEISYKNLKRSKKKYRTTVISIIVSVAIFISLSSVMTMMYEEIKGLYENLDYTLSVYYKADSFENEEQKIDQIINLDGVKDYSIVNTTNLSTVTITNKLEYSKDYKRVALPYNDGDIYVLISRVGDHAYEKYLKKLGISKEAAKGKGIFINYVDIYNEKNGDDEKVECLDIRNNQRLSLAITNYEEDYDSGEVVEKFVDIDIIKVTKEKPFGLYISGHPQIILDDETYNELFDDQMNNNIIYIDAENADDLQDQIERLTENDDVLIDNVLEAVRTSRSLMLLLGIFFYGFIIVITLIGVTNIFNTITTNMELRQKEFAMLKSVGMTKKEFNRMVRLETFFYGTKALLIGLPIGIGLSILLYKLLTRGATLRFYPVPYLAIIISIVAVFALIACIMKYSINKINKQNIIETIRNENI